MPARRPAALHSIQNSPDRVPPFARCALCPLPPKSADDCPSDKPREPLFFAVPSCPPYADSRNTTRVFAAHFDRSSISHYPARARHHSRCLSPYQRAPILVKYNEMFLLFIDKESGSCGMINGRVKLSARRSTTQRGSTETKSPRNFTTAPSPITNSR